ncbi:MAG: hypothetical protein RMM29_05520 [Planctomycetota bacterium]|nr:hypothetical protein [Planctomycetota bacterium]
MSAPYVSTRSGRVPWFLQRVSAILLIGFAGGHFALQHFTSDAVSTGLTVAARLNDPFWQAYYAAFMVLAMYHGMNGAVGIIHDYNPPRRWRVVIEVALWSLAAFFTVLGIRNVVSPVPLAAVKESYAARGFPAGDSRGNPPSLPRAYDFREELRELALLEYYLEHHTHRTEGAPLAEVFAHRPEVRLRDLPSDAARAAVAASGEAFDRWAQAVIATGPVPPEARRRGRAFSSSYEFALWAAHVRVANARARGDLAVLQRWASLPPYRATELH